jgi:hypothetical protein
MSFLSRKPARPGGRGGDAGRDDEYDDFDGYAHDGYQSEDDGWSPNEYFSPEGIKGRWAGEHPDGRAGGRGGRGAPAPGYDSYGDDFNGGGPGYGPDEFATGAYDLPEGADDDRPSRPSRRRRRDREDSGERTGIFGLRRDRGEDIWPDDGISDEDYWASVAADRPLNGADAPPDNFPSGPGGPGGPRPGPDARAPRGGADPRFGGDQRGERGGGGRLGPPPGLAADYQPAGALGGSGQGGSGRAGSGPLAARPGTGPQPARPGTGPTPTVGVTSSRPPAGQSGMRPGPAAASSGFGQPAPRPSFQPAGQPAGAPAASGRQPDRNDWDRTERIERVNASGFPDPRPASRGPGSGPGERARSSGPLGAPVSYGTGPAGSPGRGRPDNGRADLGRASDGGRPDSAGWTAADRRDQGRDTSWDASAAWPTSGRGAAPARAADDDPLTSTAYSRSALGETDGRSYRVAARRSQAQATLTDQAETFITGGYPQAGQYSAGRTGEYWQYRDDAPTTTTQPPAGRYPAPGSQAPRSQGTAAQSGHPQPTFTQTTPAPGPGSSRGNPGRPVPGQYDSQPSRPPQRQQQPQRQPGQSQLPAAGLPGGPGGGLPTVSLPAAPAGGTPPVPAANGQSGARPGGAGGLNPYDSATTGSYPYPYPSQASPGRPAQAGPAQDAADDRYYRPSHAADSGQNGAGQGRTDQGRPAYGNGYPAGGDRRY